MHELTLEGLLRAGNSEYTRETAKLMVIVVKAYDNMPEIIINPKENFAEKLEYYKKTYDDNLVMKNNQNIKIVSYNFVEKIEFGD